MTTLLKDRLERALAHAGMNQTQVEREAELTKGYLSRPLAGQRKRLDPASLAAIARVCGVRSEWLADGTPPMLAAGKPEPRVVRDEVEAPPAEDATSVDTETVLRAISRAHADGNWTSAEVARANVLVKAGKRRLDPNDDVDAFAKRLLQAIRRAGDTASADAIAIELAKGKPMPSRS